MALRAGHGNGAGVPRIEVLPADELPAGIPDDARDELPTDRAPGGRFAPGNTLARRGGAGKIGKTRLAERLGFTDMADDAAFRPYKASAVSFRRAHCTQLAKTVGGGVCGPGPSSIVATAALQLAWSRYLSDRASAENDADLAIKSAKLGNDSRQNLLAAHELCAREAALTPRANHDPLAAFLTKGSR